MENVVKSKKKIIVGVAAMIILLSVTLGLIWRLNRKETGNESYGTEMNDTISDDVSDNDNDDELKNEETKDTETKKETGLDVVETPNGKIDSVDGSGSWDDKGTTNDSPGTDKNDVTTSENNKDTNILVDDKVWGDVK